MAVARVPAQAKVNLFLRILGRPNVGVNFDPANMILYDKGDPLDALRALGCRSAQGYLFAPAVPEAELVTVLGDMITIAETRASTR